MNPFFYYYIVLYLLIIGTNLFRIVSQQKAVNVQESASAIIQKDSFPWRKVFFVSNEIIYTGTGVYIELLGILTNSNWAAPLTGTLIFLIFVSLSMEANADKFKDSVKLSTHLSIILIVVFATFYAYYLPNKPLKPSSQAYNSSYNVIIPYQDGTLVENYGYDKFGTKTLCYVLKISAKDENEAKKNAIEQFWNDRLVRPIVEQKKRKSTVDGRKITLREWKQNRLTIIENLIFIEQIKIKS